MRIESQDNNGRMANFFQSFLFSGKKSETSSIFMKVSEFRDLSLAKFSILLEN